MMDKRERILAWSKIAKAAVSEPKGKHICPIDNKTVLNVKVIDYDKYNKIEETLFCETCNITRTITFNKDIKSHLKIV